MIDPNSPVFCKIQPAEGCLNKTFYEVGKSHVQEAKPKIQKNGFHCCSNFLHCFEYCDDLKDHKYFRVQLGTNIENINETLFCSNEMHVIEEWSREKVLDSITEEMCNEAMMAMCLNLFPKT